MCQLTVKIELEQMKWSVTALAQLAGAPGSFERENARNAARGMEARLDWCLAQINSNGPFIGLPTTKP